MSERSGWRAKLRTQCQWVEVSIYCIFPTDIVSTQQSNALWKYPVSSSWFPIISPQLSRLLSSPLCCLSAWTDNDKEFLSSFMNLCFGVVSAAASISTQSHSSTMIRWRWLNISALKRTKQTIPWWDDSGVIQRPALQLCLAQDKRKNSELYWPVVRAQ